MIITCKQCGKSTKKTPTSIKRSKYSFCSRRCCAIYYNDNPTEKIKQKRQDAKKRQDKTCPSCSSKFYPRTSNPDFCCLTCKRKYLYEQGEISRRSTIKNVMQLYDDYKHRCQICGIKQWMKKPIVLILDHIDGDSTNNLPSNLRLICSNCDSQLPTYKNKNKGNGRHKRLGRYHNGQSY